jgi:hypothetical protein
MATAGLSSEDLQEAKVMKKNYDITVAAVARRLNVAASTLPSYSPLREPRVWKNERMLE